MYILTLSGLDTETNELCSSKNEQFLFYRTKPDLFVWLVLFKNITRLTKNDIKYFVALLGAGIF